MGKINGRWRPKMIAVCDGYLSRFLWQSHETEHLSELWQASDLTFEDKMDWPTLLIAKLESEINYRVVARRGRFKSLFYVYRPVF